MDHRTHRAGFLLLEACISLALVSIFAFIIALWHVQLITLQEELAERIQIAMLARSMLEEYKARGRVPLLKKEGYAISWENHPDPNGAPYVDVSVTISKVSDKKKSFSLKTGLIWNEKRNEPR